MRNHVSLAVKTRIAIVVAAAAVGLFGATVAHADDTSGSTPAPAATPTPTTSPSTSQPWG